MDFPRTTGDGAPSGQDEAARSQNVIPFPQEAPPPTAAAPESATAPPPVPLTGVHLWARRLQLVVFVLFCVQVGMFLVVLPWTPLWTENAFFRGYPQWRELLNSGFIRGVATGFGLLDIYVGIREAVLYSEPKA